MASGQVDMTDMPQIIGLGETKRGKLAAENHNYPNNFKKLRAQGVVRDLFNFHYSSYVAVCPVV